MTEIKLENILFLQNYVEQSNSENYTKKWPRSTKKNIQTIWKAEKIKE